MRLIDASAKGEDNPKYRSRLVARDLRWADPDLYTATPPIVAVPRSLGGHEYVKAQAEEELGNTMVNDVAGACFNAPSGTPAFVEICDGGHGHTTRACAWSGGCRHAVCGPQGA